MKKIRNSLFVLVLLAGTAALMSCGSTKIDETVTSSLASDHMTVQQIKSGVKVVLNKKAEEDINFVEVVDVENGTMATVSMGTKLTQGFYWPFATMGKEYTFCAKLYGNKNYKEEFVTFKVENECTSAVEYTDAYRNSKLILIADGNERVVRLDSSKKALSEVFAEKAVKDVKLQITVYPGKKADEASTDPIATLTKPLDEKADIDDLIKGYDLIKNANLFKLTPAEMNAKLSAQPFYHAKATVIFTPLYKYPEGIQFSTALIPTNDTVYTPIASADLPAASSSGKSKDSK